MNEQESAALEAQACALMNQYGFFLPATVKDFFRKLALSLNWQKLERKL